MFSFVEVDLNNDVFRRQMNKWLFFSFVKVSFNKVLFFDEDKLICKTVCTKFLDDLGRGNIIS